MNKVPNDDKAVRQRALQASFETRLRRLGFGAEGFQAACMEAPEEELKAAFLKLLAKDMKLHAKQQRGEPPKGPNQERKFLSFAMEMLSREHVRRGGAGFQSHSFEDSNYGRSIGDVVAEDEAQLVTDGLTQQSETIEDKSINAPNPEVAAQKTDTIGVSSSEANGLLPQSAGKKNAFRPTPRLFLLSAMLLGLAVYLAMMLSSNNGQTKTSNVSLTAIKKWFSQLSNPEVTDHIWVVNGTRILPDCLETVWASGDNYEEYGDQFPNAKNFIDYPGKYWGTVVPISPFRASWGDMLSIPQRPRDCNRLGKGDKVVIEGNLARIEYAYVNPNYPTNYPNTYRLLAEWGKKECDKVVPAFSGQCHSLVFVEIDNAHATYGQFNNTYAYISENGNDYVLPVTNNIEMEDFLKLLRKPKI